MTQGETSSKSNYRISGFRPWQSLRFGDREGVAFLVSTYKRHWRITSLTLLLNLLAMGFESSTIGVLVLALQTLASPSVEGLVDQFPALGPMFEILHPKLGQGGLFLLLVVIAVVAQLAVSALDFGSRAVTASLQATVEGDLRKRIFRQFMRMSYAQVMRYETGDLTSYNDQVNYVGHVIQLANLIASQLFMMLAYVILLTWLSWPMTVAAVVVVGLLFTVLRQIIRRIQILGREFTRAGVSLSARTVEFLNALRVVRTFGREQYAIQQVDEAIGNSVASRRRGLVWHSTMGPLADALTMLGVATFLIGGYLLLYDGKTEALPRLITFLFVLYRLLPRIKFVNDRLGYVSSYWEFINRVSGILRDDDKEFKIPGRRPFAGLRHSIAFEDVWLRYVEGERWALQGLSYSVARGEMLALVGESGSGKSSVADLLVGLYEPSRGRILVDGEDLRELDWLSWREHIAVVSDDSFIFHSTVRENIAFGRLGATEGEIVAAAKTAHAHDFTTSLPEGYETTLGEKGYRLSSGERQRLAIARAILRNPQVLVLDEATSHLDTDSERLIQDALADLRADRTILVIAHRLSTVTSADRILVLSEGRLVEEGTHEELLDRNGHYARFWKLQSEA